MTETPTMVQCVADSCRGVVTDKRDYATMRLALKYAAILDDATERFGDSVAAYEVYDKIGPRLLTVLAALGLTPAARGKGAATGERTTARPIDELRARRDSRQHGTAPVDPAAT